MGDFWLTVDTFLRGGAISILLVCGIAFVLGTGLNRRSASIASFGVALSSYLVASSSGLEPSDEFLATLFIVIGGSAPVLIYWASLELFLDEINLSKWQILVGLVALAGAWTCSFFDYAVFLRGAAVIVLFCHLFYVILSSADGDLVEERRQFRRRFLAVVIALVLLITTIELTDRDENWVHYLYALHAAIFLALSSTLMIWAARVSPDIWFSSHGGPKDPASRSPASIALASRAKAAMANGLWQEEGLAIGTLAIKLNSKEHRLRRAIIEELGFRNFPSFINSYRIEAAKQMLSNPEKAEIPVLTIAYDVGFASLGPFNRAFRAATGTTPTEFRRQAITEMSGESL